MTRREVYGVGLLLFLAALGMTIAAIIIPEWINWEPDMPGPSKPVKYTYGLHTRCTTLTHSCTPFPVYNDCQGSDRAFCSLWRTAGFAMSASLVLQLAGLVAFAIPIFGGKQKRQQGWALLAGVLAVTALCQVVGMGIVAGLKDHDDRFFGGWVFGRSFVLGTVSWSIMMLVAVGLVASRFLLEDEGGYELIPDRPTIR